MVFSIDEWDESFSRLRTPDGRIQLSIPELYAELDGLAGEPAPASGDFPFVLSAGERRSFTANTIIRNPDWRKKDRAGALRMHPERRRARRASRTADGCGSSPEAAAPRSRSRSPIACSPDTSRFRTGSGSTIPMGAARRVATGVSPNELTRAEDRDWVAGTPWHKYTPARVEAL